MAGAGDCPGDVTAAIGGCPWCGTGLQGLGSPSPRLSFEPRWPLASLKLMTCSCTVVSTHVVRGALQNTLRSKAGALWGQSRQGISHLPGPTWESFQFLKTDYQTRGSAPGAEREERTREGWPWTQGRSSGDTIVDTCISRPLGPSVPRPLPEPAGSLPPWTCAGQPDLYVRHRRLTPSRSSRGRPDLLSTRPSLPSHGGRSRHPHCHGCPFSGTRACLPQIHTGTAADMPGSPPPCPTWPPTRGSPV